LISAAVRRCLEQRLGSSIESATPLSGGSINDAYAASLADGRSLFVKENREVPAEMFQAEARGLSWLRETATLRIPEVLAVAGPGEPPYLALELISSGRRHGDFAERLGRGLARMHRFGADAFGLDHDNFIGRLPQENASQPSWPEFYWTRRIEPQVAMAVDRGLMGRGDVLDFERLCDRLEELVGPDEPPARLHGDLWGGNLHVDEHGQPCLIDPAAYAGHREVDLAMMQLFGGFEARVFSAYHEEYPLDPQWRERTALYQLYFLLVHVNLFGAGYLGQTRAALHRYL